MLRSIGGDDTCSALRQLFCGECRLEAEAGAVLALAKRRGLMTQSSGPGGLEPIGLSIKEACKLCSLGRTKFCELLRDEKIPSHKCGRRTIILKAELEAWLKALPRVGMTTNNAESSQRESTRLSTALRYAEAGLPVAPMHGLKNGSCTCGNDDCKRPGEHPRTPNGIADATTDPGKIKEFWTKWPSAKIGIATGAPDIIAVTVKGDAGTVCPSESAPRQAPTSNKPDSGRRK
jgi:excisionase family DNA binding protein